MVRYITVDILKLHVQLFFIVTYLGTYFLCSQFTEIFVRFSRCFDLIEIKCKSLLVMYFNFHL